MARGRRLWRSAEASGLDEAGSVVSLTPNLLAFELGNLRVENLIKRTTEFESRNAFEWGSLEVCNGR
jgi:hypothetical protein